MISNSKNKAQEQKEKIPETPEQRIHRHLKDMNSEITDEDIRNVKTELMIRQDTNPAITPAKTNKKQRRPKRQSDHKTRLSARGKRM